MTETSVGEETITVLGYDDRGDDRGIRDVLRRRSVRVVDLKGEMAAFVEKMKDVVGEVPAELGRYSIDTVTLTLEVSATGKVNLIGAGGEVTGTGGIELTLKRSGGQTT